MKQLCFWLAIDLTNSLLLRNNVFLRISSQPSFQLPCFIEPEPIAANHKPSILSRENQTSGRSCHADARTPRRIRFLAYYMHFRMGRVCRSSTNPKSLCASRIQMQRPYMKPFGGALVFPITAPCWGTESGKSTGRPRTPGSRTMK